MRTLFDKVWDAHVVRDLGDGECLLHVDRHWLNDAGYSAFVELDRRELTVRRPDLTFAVVDHLIETHHGRGYASRTPHAEEWGRGLAQHCRLQGVRFIDLDDRRHGITHVIAPELGLTLPGMLILCTDSHTCTNGAFGSIACGVGSFGATHVLATQTVILRRPRTMLVRFAGVSGRLVGPKDIILALIGRYGARAGLDHAIEFAGDLVATMGMEARMTVCNMGVEFGAVTAMITPDETTFDYLAGREFAPRGRSWDDAVAHWQSLSTDTGASFDAVLDLDCGALAPQVTWGTSPEHVVGVDELVPDASRGMDESTQRSRERALEYMGLTPGAALEGLFINAAFIGSCTNARLDDLREAAGILRGRRVAPWVDATCVPGSASVKAAAEAEGLDRIFEDAGFRWGEAGCSLCMSAIDAPAPGSRIVSSTNRSSEGRQGPGVRTHLASPATVAASAVAGAIADVRKFAA